MDEQRAPSACEFPSFEEAVDFALKLRRNGQQFTAGVAILELLPAHFSIIGYQHLDRPPHGQEFMLSGKHIRLILA